ncbi:hypothetical protein J6590_077329 [Homalodisca vitripennis]|nr:hypothetical protein J6590_077329 [Homalodisca vitripennis]
MDVQERHITNRKCLVCCGGCWTINRAHYLLTVSRQEVATNTNFIHPVYPAFRRTNQKNNELLKTIDELKQENINLKAKVTKLGSWLEDVEQSSRLNSVEIFGVPEGKNEDTYEVVKNIGVAWDLTEDPQVEAKDAPEEIIVKFVRREDQIKFLAKRKVKRNFSTQHLGFEQPAHPVYINENLSPGRRNLYSAAREVKKTRKYTYLWIQNEKILMRKDQESSVVRIASMDDLDGL